MKALLLKDFYMMTKYCRSYVPIIIVFTAGSLFSPESSFFSAYVCLITGMLPITLMAYDERSKWDNFSGALPYSRAQIVFAKYLIGMLAQIAAVLFSMLIRIAVKGFDNILIDISIYAFGFAATCTTVGLILPFMFGFGVEKGRLAYYILMITVFGLTFAVTNSFGADETAEPLKSGLLPASAFVILAAVVLYGASCLISAAIYKRREVK